MYTEINFITSLITCNSYFCNHLKHMKIQFKIEMKPISINKVYMKNHALSSEARRWKMEFSKRMREYKEEIASFVGHFDDEKHKIEVHIINYLDNMITARGSVSHASGDVDNYNKLTLDGVFACLDGIDDCVVTKLLSEKKAYHINLIEVYLNIVDIN